MFGMGRRELIIFVIVMLAIVFGVGYRLANMPSVLDEETSFVVNENDEKAGQLGIEADNNDNNHAVAEVPQITVHVAGAVKKPGVYKLPEGSRVVDALNLAEAAVGADLEQLNLAAEIEDGEQIPVPRKDVSGAETIGSKSKPDRPGSKQSAAKHAAKPGKYSAGAATGKARPGNGKVNINKAEVVELDTLPGIGPALADRIVEYRESQGKFMDVSELKNVSGIGDKKYAGLVDMVTVK